MRNVFRGLGNFQDIPPSDVDTFLQKDERNRSMRLLMLNSISFWCDTLWRVEYGICTSRRGMQAIDGDDVTAFGFGPVRQMHIDMCPEIRDRDTAR